MNSKLSNHLNDDQFMECAIGVEPSVEAAAHLRECEACREELARFGMSVNSFNSATQAWGESLPPMSVRGASAGQQGYQASRPLFAMASYALAACLMLAVGFEVVHHEPGSGSGSVSTASAPQEDSAAQIAQDNKLLMAVDVAIRSDDRSPVQEYGLAPEPNGRARTRGTTREQ
jgi:predicted anti-sigma-YlaC factor YlaD